jgi:hypothetical protein
MVRVANWPLDPVLKLSVPETVADPEPVAVQVTLKVPVAVTGAVLYAG